MNHIEAMKQALTAFEQGLGHLARDVLRTAIEAAQPAFAHEPLGKLCVFDDADSEFGWSYDISGNAEQHRRLKELDGAMIYTAPPAAQPAAPLTDEQINEAAEEADNETAFIVGFSCGARFAEAAHGIAAAPEKGQP